MALLLPPINLETVAAYNSRGAALVDAIRTNQIAPLHHEFILGIFAIYSMLISMGHITESDIHWPPHTNESFFSQAWLEAGFERSAVDILTLLPYFKEEFKHWNIAPQAEALSYLGHPIPCGCHPEPDHTQLRCWNFVGTDLIHPNHVRLTDGGRDGNNYIYDTSTGSILILNMYFNMYVSSERGNDYTKTGIPFVPAKEVMDNWLQNLHDLVYMPWVHEEDSPIHIQPGPREFDHTSGQRTVVSDAELFSWANEPKWNKDTIYPYDSRRNGANFVRSIRNIYHAHGWPKDFDKESCFVALERFSEERSEYESAVSDARPVWVPFGEYHPNEAVPRTELATFLENSAGTLAILAVKHDEL